ncbi:TPA: hypothetical protein KQE54_000193 [Clostridioides difficile]|nr:hypothetical protein [Clostridioides difficile]
MTTEYTLTKESLLSKMRNQSCTKDWDAVYSYDLKKFNDLIICKFQKIKTTLTRSFSCESYISADEVVIEFFWPILNFEQKGEEKYCNITLTTSKVSEKKGETLTECKNVKWKFQMIVPLTQIIGTLDMTQATEDTETLYFKQGNSSSDNVLLLFKNIDICKFDMVSNGDSQNESLMKVVKNKFRNEISMLVICLTQQILPNVESHIYLIKSVMKDLLSIVMGEYKRTVTVKPKEFLLGMQEDENHLKGSISFYFQLEGSEKRGSLKDLEFKPLEELHCPFPETMTASLMIDQDWIINNIVKKAFKDKNFSVLEEEQLNEGYRIVFFNSDKIKVEGPIESGFLWKNNFSGFEIKNSYTMLIQNGEVKLEFSSKSKVDENYSAGSTGASKNGHVKIDASQLFQGVQKMKNQFSFIAKFTNSDIKVSGSMGLSYKNNVLSSMNGKPNIGINLDVSNLISIFFSDNYDDTKIVMDSVLYAPKDFITFFTTV